MPIPYKNDRRVHHDEMAVKLQVSQAAKRVKTAQKAKETKSAKTGKKRKRSAEPHGSDQDLEEAGQAAERGPAGC